MVRNAELADEDRPQHEAFARTVIAGHPDAAIRRIILWVLLFGFTASAIVLPLTAIPALICAALLAMTDQLA